MADDKIHMPSGMGGLTRYFEEYKSRFQFRPHVIVLFIALFILFELAVRWVF